MMTADNKFELLDQKTASDSHSNIAVHGAYMLHASSAMHRLPRREHSSKILSQNSSLNRMKYLHIVTEIDRITHTHIIMSQRNTTSWTNHGRRPEVVDGCTLSNGRSVDVDDPE